MSDAGMITVVVFVMATTLVLLLSLMLGGRRGRLGARLEDLGSRAGPSEDPAAKMARSALPRLGAALVPKNLGERGRLKTRLMQAGLYKRHAMAIFYGIKVVLMISPVMLGVFMSSFGLVSPAIGLIFGALAGMLGTILPSFWLDRRKSNRQIRLRRAMPDALDVIVVCVEGGLSLQGAFARVGSELRAAHPLLAQEMGIVQREIQLGRATGDALRQFADRFDVEELRSLASVITQTERFGASIVKALRVHADALRLKRQQRAEEMAQKAGTKMLFPTILLIFPAMFVVILGPAVFQIIDLFKNLKFGGGP